MSKSKKLKNIRYNQPQVDNIAELERRLEDAGYAVGARVMELLNLQPGEGEPERDTVTWNFIFHEDEYMISEKELLVNRLRLL
ncbi:BnaC09g33560D [Brassica napus]|uniref:(rape) hypothetical protein n=1 Tax=Brassica napus TaxID=3708 RepID=A0A078I1B8_BRANA|nr:unnamed protein product [Brassica napus]CDY43887.1 BnaC09g33560D [Brassica napus]